MSGCTLRACHAITAVHIATQSKTQVTATLVIVWLTAGIARSTLAAITVVASTTVDAFVPQVVRLLADCTRSTRLSSVGDVHVTKVTAVNAASGT